eukprot:3224589-Pyramimonas_sp.AAC.1
MYLATRATIQVGAFWRPLGPSGGHLERLGAIIRRLGTLLDRFRGPLGALVARVEAILGPKSRATSLEETRQAPG